MRKYTIDEIAELAGVSAGTVDRVIHNRGEVSKKSKDKVEAVLKDIDYHPNLSASSIGTKKKFTIVVLLPAETGEYWRNMREGIEKAHYELSLIKLDIRFFHYDQFNVFSFKEVCGEVLQTNCDAVILGPSFLAESQEFARELDEKKIPYVLVDEYIPGANPLSFFGPDSVAMGRIAARLILSEIEKDKDIAILVSRRVGDQVSINSGIRQESMLEFLKEHAVSPKIIECVYDANAEVTDEAAFDKLFSENGNIGCMVVFNSRGHIPAAYLEMKGLNNIKIIGSGKNTKNVEALKKGHISFLLSEHPELQGYLAFRRVIEHLLFGTPARPVNYTPIDIIIKENVDFYE